MNTIENEHSLINITAVQHNFHTMFLAKIKKTRENRWKLSFYSSKRQRTISFKVP